MRKAETLLKFRPPNLNHIITMAQATIPIPQLTEENKRNFLKKVSTTPTASGCLEWIGAKSSTLYGNFWASGKAFGAHRVAYFLATGIDPKEFHVCHSCDNPICVNPEHLWLGTGADNVNDREMKGRGNQPRGECHGSKIHPEKWVRGEKHNRTKLKDSHILLIRSDLRPQKLIAADYGVRQCTVSAIKRRKTWAHVA